VRWSFTNKRYCVPSVANVSGLSTLDCSFDFIQHKWIIYNKVELITYHTISMLSTDDFSYYVNYKNKIRNNKCWSHLSLNHNMVSILNGSTDMVLVSRTLKDAIYLKLKVVWFSCLSIILILTIIDLQTGYWATVVKLSR